MLSFVCALLVILIAAFWAFQGFFSAAIMFFETLVALMVAVGFYEPLADNFKDSIDPSLGEPGALMLTFFLTLGLQRFLTDKFIPGNVRMNMYVDRVAGGAFGLFTGLTTVGLALIAIQMLPLGRSVLGFERFRIIESTDAVEPSRVVRNKFLLNPDGFTVGLLSMVGNERFAWGDTRFAVEKPEWLEDLHYRRSGPQAQCRTVLPSDALTVYDAYQVDSIQELQFFKQGDRRVRRTNKPATKDDLSTAYLVCSVGLKRNINETGKNFALFTPEQFRLFGPRPRPGARSAAPKMYPAVGMSDIYVPPPDQYARGEQPSRNISKQQAGVLVRLDHGTPLMLSDDNAKAIIKGEEYELEVVFEVPADFEPWYMEFKQGARAQVRRRSTTGDEESAPAAPRSGRDSTQSRAPRPAPAPQPEEPQDESSHAPVAQQTETADASTSGRRPSGNTRTPAGERPKGRTHVLNTIEERTGVYDDLPLALSASALAQAARGGKFREGHIVADTPDDLPPEGERITKFWVPEDKRMVQIGNEYVMAGSFLGRPLELARSTLKQWYLRTADGRNYFARGWYIEATADGKRQIEIQWWPEAEVEERALEDMRKFTRNVMATQRDYKMGLLFLVDPGVTITHFHTSSRTAETLTKPIEVPN